MRLEDTWFVAAFHSTAMHDPGQNREFQLPVRVCVCKGGQGNVGIWCCIGADKRKSQRGGGTRLTVRHHSNVHGSKTHKILTIANSIALLGNFKSSSHFDFFGLPISVNPKPEGRAAKNKSRCFDQKDSNRTSAGVLLLYILVPKPHTVFISKNSEVVIVNTSSR